MAPSKISYLLLGHYKAQEHCISIQEKLTFLHTCIELMSSLPGWWWTFNASLVLSYISVVPVCPDNRALMYKVPFPHSVPCLFISNNWKQLHLFWPKQTQLFAVRVRWSVILYKRGTRSKSDMTRNQRTRALIQYGLPLKSRREKAGTSEERMGACQSVPLYRLQFFCLVSQ